MAGTKINEANLRETLQGTESIPIVDTDLPNGRVTAEKLKRYVQPDKLPTARTIDGKQFDGSKNIAHFTTCSTAGGTAVKEVTMSDFTIDTGSRLDILFNNANTANNVSLSVNGSQAHPICYQGAQIGKGVLKAGCVYMLEYYQGKWHIVGEFTEVDGELDGESTNPVQNKVITEKVNSMQEDLNLLLGAGYGMWYGVEWDVTQAASAVTRIGNMDLHKSLPIQSGMYRCVLNDDGEEAYKLGANDSTKKEDGVTAAVLDGTDGMVMVRIPAFYAKFVTDGDKQRILLSEYALPGFRKMGDCYLSAYEATIDRTASGTPKLASVVNTTANFRGGNNNAEWDGTYRSLLGMPATLTSLTNFRTYARNRKADSTEWNCMEFEAYKAIYWLYVVEYANLNCQLAFNDELTAEGFRQGGLGNGVTNLNSEKWNTFNGYYPFIPCGHTNSLGNKTGVVAFTMPDEYDAETPLITYVPSYRGIENPFGHIWKWTDGIHVKVQSEDAGGKSILYTSNNPANYQDTDYDGYEEKGEIARASGYIKKILLGDDGDIIVSKDGNTGGSSTTYFCDYFYTNIPSSGEVLRGVLFGGRAAYGSTAGFSSAVTYNAPSLTSAYVGSRLCFITDTARSV